MSKFEAGDRVRHNLHLNRCGTVTIADSDGCVMIYWDGEERVTSHLPSLVSKMLTFDTQPEETRSTSDSGAEKGVQADSESVNHPAHYGGDTTYEVIKVITAWGLGFDLGNVTKYVARAGKKDPTKELEDLRKARFYLDHRIKQLEQS